MGWQVVSTGPNPEWDESFSWTFESPPKGQKLHISCKNKSKVGKVNVQKHVVNAAVYSSSNILFLGVIIKWIS